MGFMRGVLTMPAPRKYPLELRERAVRMYRASEPKPVIRRLAEDLGVHHEALRDQMGYVLRWPFEQRLLDADLAAASAGLGEDAFATAYAEGRRLDEDAAVAYATRARGERRRPAHGWDSLTATEADVARLAAAGLTNKQIAGRLLMGAETVKTHMARVYDKLGVHTRASLAAAVTSLTTPPGRSSS